MLQTIFGLLILLMLQWTKVPKIDERKAKKKKTNRDTLWEIRGKQTDREKDKLLNMYHHHEGDFTMD